MIEELVELVGIEPTTSSLRTRTSPIATAVKSITYQHLCSINVPEKMRWLPAFASRDAQQSPALRNDFTQSRAPPQSARSGLLNFSHVSEGGSYGAVVRWYRGQFCGVGSHEVTAVPNLGRGT